MTGFSGDTIAAIATPPGQGGVAVVRVSGSEARLVVEKVLRRGRGRGLPQARTVYVGTVHEASGGAAIDRVIAFWMPGPRSYTGEDVVEVQCHGGSLVSGRVLESLLAAGARAAEPGEFTKRALLNGRLDLAQAEAVADLIAARSESARRLAWSQLDGLLSGRVGVLRDAVVAARALCEAAIDFPDEDIPELEPGTLDAELRRIRTELDRLVASFERGRLRYEGARAVLVGKPNVGKSSLLNALAGRERAIVTPVAGTTRDVVEATIALPGGAVVVADTAGIRDACDGVERLGAERAHAAIEDAGCVLAVLDGSDALDEDDQMVAAAIGERAVIVLVNKSDLRQSAPEAEIARAFPRAIRIRVSALTRHGLDEVERALGTALFGGSDAGGEDEVTLFRERHRDAARVASEGLARAESGLLARVPTELIASDLAAATDALGSITGEISNEDVLDRVFSEFCLGK